MSWHHSGDKPLPGTLITPFRPHISGNGSNGSTTNIWFNVIHDFVLFHRSDEAILRTNCLHPMNWCTGMCSFSESLFIMFPRCWDSKSIRFKIYHHVINSVACPAGAKIDLVVLSRDLCNAWAIFINLHSAITVLRMQFLARFGMDNFHTVGVCCNKHTRYIYIYVYYNRKFLF